MKKKKAYNVAVVGAKGAVGHEMIRILEERKFPVKEFRLFGSARSAGQTVKFRGENYTIRELKFCKEEFKGIDIILSSPGASISKKFAPFALEAGAVIVDNTSAFRMDPKVPLVVPEINGKEIKKHRGIIANPNCSAIIMLMAVAPLHKKNRVRRLICSTYQSVSGAGAKAMEELKDQTAEYLKQWNVPDSEKKLTKKVFSHQIAFNLFSHNASIEENGYNGEELKMIAESRKILGDSKMRMTTTCIRVPVFRAHSETIYLEFEKKMSVEEARAILGKAPGVKLVDDRKTNYFPMPIEASGKDNVLVGRIREDLSAKNSLALFVAGDQLRKGAALNAVQIAEVLIA
ncbi:MAG: aspartate-semialdehyde dehydrogenase [Omnitrophica bacterium RIFCSPLOWO2_12_FULL_44_17]|uniref:Aspartate-semialdehyde dehydrogenase n=1 Tax=Candidatus Danuiimicrobium aquiferis TaxID=1801832 RepID=A0A1G1KSD3_9BACT|nr:MAG: aspartate-semialdehyde dehydrogenase [Omnitrophica bacterium RIFCSPHIGHO2_02_FULL_45_28]OGW89411.1 MAG: aspartate-semialdehyde dehydrogenase [Omnitrophica bacterium RIFCSPHIGHO2_12_FULL_44_12]OGW95836.1 MAG: aspartate-semialdehyde dehydrogenase [Omnitrophica bacterium RIFCSPLOWO2_12_FULL_44_17]OGX01937.1 MAG: aspartate-semialdehyde dehydrogenase [Omnitrophica bacterium RIFCSPLOWO2_02_FULL_44_11]